VGMSPYCSSKNFVRELSVREPSALEDATYASFTNRVAKIASSPSWCSGVTLVREGGGVGVGVGVGVGWVEMSGVGVVWWGVSNELVDEELLVGSVKSEAVELLFEVFCELFV
jgi:hypothetical protein